jgi:aerobic-type carbon monoxide dehydrogenase small subunit (CoxS/CutS family)
MEKDSKKAEEQVMSIANSAKKMAAKTSDQKLQKQLEGDRCRCTTLT